MGHGDDGPPLGVLVLQDAPFPTLVERWRQVEGLGFDQLFVADHTGDYRDTPSGPWFDGWTVLAAMAAHTTGIRIGNAGEQSRPASPAVLAKAAVTSTIFPTAGASSASERVSRLAPPSDIPTACTCASSPTSRNRRRCPPPWPRRCGSAGGSSIP